MGALVITYVSLCSANDFAVDSVRASNYYIDTTEIRARLQSAKSMAKTGLALTCAGSGVGAVGSFVVLKGIFSELMNGESNTLNAGISIVSVGIVMYITGPVVANVGGTKAYRVLKRSGDDTTKPFDGWIFLGLGLVCGSFGMLCAVNDAPEAVGISSNIAGSSFIAVSFVKTFVYISKAGNRFSSIKDIRVSPVVDTRSFMIKGAAVSVLF